VKAGDDSTAALKLSARLAESAGLLSEAAGSYRLLADQDARGRFEHLKSLANLQLRLGQVDKAIAAGQELVGLAAGNALSHRFLADLYFRTGQTQQAIDSLKSAVRIDGSNADTLIALAQALADRYETDAAIETLWQAFDAANAIDQKISITHTLAVLYQRSGRVEELTARLQRPPRETAEAVLQAQCLAAVYQAVDDIAMARRVLKRLLTNDRQDISVLRQLITLAEQQKDFVEAAELQARVNVIDPSPEGLQRYISLILQLPTESRPVLSLSDRQFSTLPKDAQYELVDTLVDSGELIAARRMGHSLLQQNADDRRVLLSLAVAAWKAKDADAAAESLNRILALPAQGSENLPQAVGSTGANGQQASATEEVPRVARIADRIQHVASLLGLSPGSDPLQRRLRSLGVESAEEIRLVALVARTMLAAELKNTDEYLAGLRLQADDAAAKDDGAGMDGQRVWDLYVAMSTLHGIGQATLGDIAAAAARLAELPDSDAQFAYLDSTHSQAWFEESAPNNRPARGNAPQPLQSQQIDRLLNAWKIVYQQRPDWLHEHHHVAVARECDFAARTDDTTAMLASLGRETASVTETKAVLSILARRQSVGEFVQLVRRLSQSISNGTAGAATGDLDSGLIAEDVSRLMAAVARKGEVAEWADVIREFIRLRAVELEFTAVERENLLQPESRSSVRELVVYGADGTFGRRRFGGIPADGVLGDEHLGVLATTFQALRSEGRGEQLLSVLQDLTDDSADAVRLVSQAAMAQVYSFQADTDNAALHLVRAADAWPDAVAVRLYLARFYQQSGNPREALRLLDTVKVTNPAAYLQRELLALDIAGDTGDVARARQAAGYLANLQLDANDQKVLADRMKKLGLSDAAGRVAMRTELQQHVAALDPSDRLKQFVEAGDQAAATEVARQLLYSALSRTISSSDRRQAIVILKEAGVLDAFVEDIQQKLKRNPDSLACLELLQECLDAVGDSDVAEKIRLQIANLMPVDIDQMLQVAHQLEQRGQAEQACDRYLEIARLDPTCLAVDYYRVIRTFRNARRLSELSEAMLEQDLSGLAPNAYAIQELVEQQMADSSQSAGEVGRRLFSKAWQELPMIRENLLSNISDDGIWKLPVMYDFLRAEVLPDSPSELRAYPWMKFTGSPELLPDGRMDATVCRLIRSAMQRDRCRELKVQIEAAVQTSPEWHGGHLLLAVIEGRTGEGANAKQRLAVMLSDDDVVKSLPGDVAWSVASCLVDDQLVPVDRSLLPEISRLLEIAVSATRDNAGQWGGYQRNPVQLLARLLSNAKDIQKARQVIVRHMDQGIVGLTEPGIRWPDVRMDDLVTAAQQILDAGFPVESIGLLNQITPELLSDARQRKSDARSLQDQLRNVRSRATAAITLDAIALHLSEVEGPQADSELAGRGRVAVLDFLLTVAEVEDLPRRVVSPVEKCLLSSPAETRLAGRVQSLARERIGYDPTPASAMALMGFGSGNRTQIEEALKLLDGYVAVQSSRSDTGRSEADMAIWLVARQALQSGESVAERLAEYATMSAKAMGCNDVMAAILRERGDTAVAVGNRKLAEQLRAQLLQAVLGHPDGTSPQSAALKELRQRLLDDDATGQP
jgi:tetratricopeptide (TPR) repeat protein